MEWPALLPGLTDGFDPGSSNVCVSGKVQCIDRVGAGDAAPGGAADGQLLPSGLVRAHLPAGDPRRTPGAPGSPATTPTRPWTNHAVAVFAKYYLRAFDAWTANSNSTAVPKAWKIAFDAARDGRVSAAGNFFLGLNAHINHDLGLAMAAAGSPRP